MMLTCSTEVLLELSVSRTGNSYKIKTCLMCFKDVFRVTQSV